MALMIHRQQKGPPAIDDILLAPSDSRVVNYENKMAKMKPFECAHTDRHISWASRLQM